MKLFLAGASFDPGAGGPAYSVPALGVALAVQGVTVGLWAPRAAGADVPPTAGLIPLQGPLAEAIERFGTPDLIHDNGIWLPHNHWTARLARRRGIPRIVSPRGMLEPWALSHRRLKKKVAWLAYQRRDIATADMLHATAEAEAASVRALGLAPPLCVIANGVDLPTPGPPREAADKPVRTALFLGRVHRQKGLPMLLRAWAGLQPERWELLIAGPDGNGHAAELAALIGELSLGGQVRLLGPMYGEAKAALFRAADLFVLPTYSENFGVAVAEALAYEVPVLTTRGAPWELLVTYDCGWWVDPEETAIGGALRAATVAGDAERRAMGRRGAAMVAERFDWGGIATQFIRQYETMLARR